VSSVTAGVGMSPADSARCPAATNNPAAGQGRVRRLDRGQRWTVGAAVVLGLLVTSYGLAGSYVTVADLAARHGVPLPGLVPAGIDGGLVAVVVLDLALAWIGAPVGWLRQLVRLLSVGTITANAVGGWPDPTAVGLHSAAPLMLLAMVEAGRTVLLRRMGQEQGSVRDPVPLARWVLAPWRTWLLWRRMVLWQITSYRTAVQIELDLRGAVGLLRMHYGRCWRRRVSADLVWMLRTGTAVEQACARVRALVDGEKTEPDVQIVDTDPSGASPVVSSDPPCGSVRTMPAEGCVPWLDDAAVDGERLAEAVQINREHWTELGRPVSAETLRKRLRIGARKSRALMKAVRASDRTAACGARRSA
jgi:hypothetical protein